MGLFQDERLPTLGLGPSVVIYFGTVSKRFGRSDQDEVAQYLRDLRVVTEASWVDLATAVGIGRGDPCGFSVAPLPKLNSIRYLGLDHLCGLGRFLGHRDRK